MHTTIEISLYPLDADYLPAIRSFLERLNGYPELQMQTNAMSTQVTGEHHRLFEILAQETARTLGNPGGHVFVMKVVRGDVCASS